MCPKPNDTKTPKKSHLDEFEGIPGLFDALAGEADEDKWTTFTFPVDFDSLLTGSKVEKDIKYYLRKYEDFAIIINHNVKSSVQIQMSKMWTLHLKNERTS